MDSILIFGILFKFIYKYMYISIPYRIGAKVISGLASSAIGRGFDPRGGQTKNYEIGICCRFIE
jgi:hypothetical protein